MIRITTAAASALVVLAMAGAADARMEGRAMGSGMMPDFSVIDTDADGKITKPEVEAWFAARRAGVDADGDGFVTLEEFKARARARADETAERAFARMDGDSDGKVAVGDMGMSSDRMARGQSRMFDRLDQNADGAIDQAEFDSMKDRMADRMERRGEGKDRKGDRMERHGGGKDRAHGGKRHGLGDN